MKSITNKKKDLAKTLTVKRQKELVEQLEAKVEKKETTKETKGKSK